jgi:hypothetical protein
VASLRTNAAFMDYLERCATEGATYGDTCLHISADDWNRYHRIVGKKTTGPATRTILMSAKPVLAGIAKWRESTANRVASKLAS